MATKTDEVFRRLFDLLQRLKIKAARISDLDRTRLGRRLKKKILGKKNSG